MLTIWERSGTTSADVDSIARNGVLALAARTTEQLRTMQLLVALDAALRDDGDIVHGAEGILIERLGLTRERARRHLQEIVARTSRSLEQAARWLTDDTGLFASAGNLGIGVEPDPSERGRRAMTVPPVAATDRSTATILVAR